MTDHAPGGAPRLTDATASSTREENPRTFPEGIPVRDAARTVSYTHLTLPTKRIV